MFSIQSQTGPIEYSELRTRVFDGDVLVFHGVPEVSHLIKKTQALIEDRFGAIDPVTAHNSLDTSKYQDVIGPLMRTYSHDRSYKDLCRKALVGCGVDPSKSGWCRATIRIQPPLETHASRLTSGLGPHRDVWYANLFQQLNWWAPIFKLDETRTLALYPYYWSQPIENGTQGWSLEEFRQSREEVTQNQGSFEDLKNAYANPLPTTKISEELRMPIVVEPGDIICFSAAHLHQGVPNESPFTRFSTDFRTIDLNDSIAGRGAPNIDTQSTGSAIGDFVMMDSGHPITEQLRSY